jgi:zinc finger protein
MSMGHCGAFGSAGLAIIHTHQYGPRRLNNPHVFLDLGNDNEIICPYCSTLYRFAADLKAGEARPPECVLKDKVA